MSGNHEAKVQQLVNKLKGYGQPMLIFLQVITSWELPSAWVTAFAACSLLYVILYNMSVKTFSVLGLLAAWLELYCWKNKIEIKALTQTEIEHLHQACSKLVSLQTKVREMISEFKATQYQTSTFKRQACILLAIAILACYTIDNLLLCYLIGSTALPMMALFLPSSALS